MFDYTDLIGVPFKSEGRDASGYDCYGLAMEVYRRHGIKIEEYWACAQDKETINRIYHGAAVNGKWRKVDYQHGEEIPVPAMVALRFGVPAGVVNHTGVYIGDGKFIHTREKIGVCVDSIYSIAWKKQIVGIYEYIG